MAGKSTVQLERKGAKDGMSTEFTVFAKIKPGHADALRKTLAKMASPAADANTHNAVREIGTLHDARHVMFDNDTQVMFASVFDGTWDAYIDDFAKTVVGERFGQVFQHCEDFPGITDPEVKNWFIERQAPAAVFISSYPDLTVQQIWKDQHVNEAFQALLDTPEFRELLDSPAIAELKATPEFQKLMTEAES
ncbi:hypothetical protein ACIBSW_17305 [Actinoplanes sp. NPDC049668]|uniref:hypothetical protein n=1 Tax=unclassified Actinoplanes TaxID=2626549 RepID=UPI0033BF4A5F